MLERNLYRLALSPPFERILKLLKRQKPSLLRDLDHAIAKVFREPMFGKPLRHTMRNYRRVHIGSFVLVYEVRAYEIRLLDFDHHDRIYKKYQ